MPNGDPWKVFVHENSLISNTSSECNPHRLRSRLVDPAWRMQVAIYKIIFLSCSCCTVHQLAMQTYYQVPKNHKLSATLCLKYQLVKRHGRQDLSSRDSQSFHRTDPYSRTPAVQSHQWSIFCHQYHHGRNRHKKRKLESGADHDILQYLPRTYSGPSHGSTNYNGQKGDISMFIQKNQTNIKLRNTEHFSNIRKTWNLVDEKTASASNRKMRSDRRWRTDTEGSHSSGLHYNKGFWLKFLHLQLLWM